MSLKVKIALVSTVILSVLIFLWISSDRFYLNRCWRAGHTEDGQHIIKLRAYRTLDSGIVANSDSCNRTPMLLEFEKLPDELNPRENIYDGFYFHAEVIGHISDDFDEDLPVFVVKNTIYIKKDK